MSTTRISKTPTAASFWALAGVCSLLAGLALATGATPTALGVGWGVGTSIGVITSCVLIADEDGVAHCHMISGDWKPGDPVPPAEEETATEAEVTSEADDAFEMDAFEISDATAAESGAHSDDVPPQWPPDHIGWDEGWITHTMLIACGPDENGRWRCRFLHDWNPDLNGSTLASLYLVARRMGGGDETLAASNSASAAERPARTPGVRAAAGGGGLVQPE